MITTKGKVFLKKYQANKSGQIIGAISVGIGSTAAALGDDRLAFEFARVPVNLIAYDFATDQLIFKGRLDENLVGKIYEVGIWTNEINSAAGNQASRIITSFDGDTEEWTNETLDTTIARIGPNSLKHTPGASATTSSILSGTALDLSENSSADNFNFAYNVENGNTSTLQWRFRTDASNYYQFQVSTPTSGYKFSSFAKSTATVTGTPNWNAINEIEVRTTSTGGGASAVEFDGIRLEDYDTVSPDYGLVARYIPASPITKLAGKVLEVEYALSVTV